MVASTFRSVVLRRFVIFLIALLVLPGCVSREVYELEVQRRREAENRAYAAESRAQAAEARAEAAERRLALTNSKHWIYATAALLAVAIIQAILISYHAGKSTKASQLERALTQALAQAKGTGLPAPRRSQRRGLTHEPGTNTHRG